MIFAPYDPQFRSKYKALTTERQLDLDIEFVPCPCSSLLHKLVCNYHSEELREKLALYLGQDNDCKQFIEHLIKVCRHSPLKKEWPRLSLRNDDPWRKKSDPFFAWIKALRFADDQTFYKDAQSYFFFDDGRQEHLIRFVPIWLKKHNLTASEWDTKMLTFRYWFHWRKLSEKMERFLRKRKAQCHPMQYPRRTYTDVFFSPDEFAQRLESFLVQRTLFQYSFLHPPFDPQRVNHKKLAKMLAFHLIVRKSEPLLKKDDFSIIAAKAIRPLQEWNLVIGAAYYAHNLDLPIQLKQKDENQGDYVDLTFTWNQSEWYVVTASREPRNPFYGPLFTYVGGHRFSHNELLDPCRQHHDKLIVLSEILASIPETLVSVIGFYVLEMGREGF